MSDLYPDFDGPTYDPALDRDRLTKQLGRVYDALAGGEWWTLADLARAAGGSEASVSARIRDLRKPRFGGYEVERERVVAGLFRYRLVDRAEAIVNAIR